MHDIYFETALSILRFIKKHTEGATTQDILTNFPSLHRSRLSRYLNTLERMGHIYRVKARAARRGMPPHIWFFGPKPTGSSDAQASTL